MSQDLLFESVVISVAGAACGLLLTLWTSRIIPLLLFDQDAGTLSFVPSFGNTLLTLGASLGITILAGFLPAFVIPHKHPALVLRREGAGPSMAIRRLRAGFVLAQMTSCCLLVISTAFLINALRTALETGAGHRLGNAILATVQVHPDIVVDIRYFEQVAAAVRSLPGVSVMAWAGRLPGNRALWQSLRVQPESLPLREVTFDVGQITAKSLKLLILPPLAGHFFGFGDQACRVAMANEEAAKMLFDRYTVGRTIKDSAGSAVEIIGVVATKTNTRPAIYYNHTVQPEALADRTTATMRFQVPLPTPLTSAEFDANVVSPSYFDALGFSFVAGQGFPADHSLRPECRRVAVVNQIAADLYFGGKAVGSAVIDERGQRTEIIGVVREAAIAAFQSHAEPSIYFPMAQDSYPRMTLIANAQNTNGPLLSALRSRIESVPGGASVPVVIKTLAEHLSQTAMAPLRIVTVMISASATVALLLTVLGLFSALSDSVGHRRREFAIRVALGAQRWHVIYQVLLDGGRLACVGVLAGTVASFLLSRLVAGIAPAGASPNLWTYLAAPLALAVAVIVASVLPARGASLVNPVTIMRN